MTTRYVVTVQLQSPTCMARRPTAPGQVTETITYLPGTVLRGGLAASWLAGRQYDDLDDDQQARFQRLFLHGDVQFGNAWPLSGDPQDRRRQTWIVPHTAWTRKDARGWANDETPTNRGDGVRDALVALLSTSPHPPGWNDWREWDHLNQEFASERGGLWSQVSVSRRVGAIY